MTAPPARTRRLFFGYRAVFGRPLAARDSAFVIERLLEEGDAADLRWLFGALGEGAVADWFERHAARRLSRRSRSYWSLILRRPVGQATPLARALWPLA